MDINYHPVAFAALVGFFATALNLLPVGQLDGGHIVYALFGRRHRLISRIFVFGVIPLLMFFWTAWLMRRLSHWFWESTIRRLWMMKLLSGLCAR